MDGARLLVIDDSPTIRKLVELTLRSAGWTVTFAGSGREGLAGALATRPDLVVLDYVLPDMRGIEVCARLAGDPATKDVPVVVVTAKSDEVRAQFAPYSSVIACLPKPFTGDQLRNVASAALAQRGRGAPAAGTFSREQRESAAQVVFSKLRGALASLPQWAAELGGGSPAPFFARKLLTPERIDGILEGLLPLYREVIGGSSAASAEAPNAAPASLRGELRDWPLRELLALFAASERTGELRVTAGSRALVLYLQRGETVLATTTDPDEYLRGVSLGRVPPPALARAKAEQGNTGRPVFVTLAEEGVALPAPLGDLMHRQGRRLLVEAVDGTAASFAWRDTNALPLYVEAHGRAVSAARNTLALGMPSPEAARTGSSSLEQLTLERLRSEPPSFPFGDDAVFDRARGFSDRVRRFYLESSERRVLAATDGLSSLAEVSERAALPLDEVRAVVARLTEVGLLAERGEGAPSVRPVLILEPDVDGFQRPLEELLRSRAVDSPVLSLAHERDIVAAVRRERPRLVILNAGAGGGNIEGTARALRAANALEDVALVAVLDSDRAQDAAALRAAGFDAVLVKPVPYAELERFIA
ncbi:MAG TPA: response regulator [Polyangiaceae bacterium]|jgi:CheY-like chemotaxis protein